jgi:hypothetical protein
VRLDGNKIGAEGAKAIAKALKVNAGPDQTGHPGQ